MEKKRRNHLRMLCNGLYEPHQPHSQSLAGGGEGGFGVEITCECSAMQEGATLVRLCLIHVRALFTSE